MTNELPKVQRVSPEASKLLDEMTAKPDFRAVKDGPVREAADVAEHEAAVAANIASAPEKNDIRKMHVLEQAIEQQAPVLIGEIIYSTDTPLLIGFGGLKESGKDAASEFITDEFVGWRLRGMSDALKERSLVLNPWIRIRPEEDQDILDRLMPHVSIGLEHRLTGENWGWLMRAQQLLEILGYNEAKRVLEYRVWLQADGDDAGRQIIGPDVWVEVATTRILQDKAFGQNTVMTAIRYPNELDMIRDLGGTLVWIDRPSVTAKHEAEVASGSQIATHASEHSVEKEDFDIVLLNDGTLDDLRAKVVDLVRGLSVLNGGDESSAEFQGLE